MHINTDLYESRQDLMDLYYRLRAVKEKLDNADDALAIDEACALIDELA